MRRTGHRSFEHTWSLQNRHQTDAPRRSRPVEAKLLVRGRF
jgi:hypothetical protein